MSNLQIKALIVLSGTSITAIAKKTGVSREWVSYVVNGHKKSLRVQKAIAAAVGKTVEELWPKGGNNEAA